MSKSIKLKDNNYIDSTSVINRDYNPLTAVTQRVPLNKYITMYKSQGTGSTGKKYIKLLTIKPKQRYQTLYLKFTALESENVSFVFNGDILLHLDTDKIMSTSRSRYFSGSYVFNDINAKMVMYVENNTAGNIEVSLYCYLPTYNWRSISIGSIISNGLGYITFEENGLTDSEPSYVYKTEI